MSTMTRYRHHLTSTLIAGALLFTTPVLADSGTEAFDREMQPILTAYLKIQEKLAADSIDGVAAEADSIASKAATLDPTTVTGEHAAHYAEIPQKLEQAAREVSDATGIDAVRRAFKDLSRPMTMWATMSRPAGVNVVFCPMAQASWLQREGRVHNPYYGAEMPNCGQVMRSAGHTTKPMAHGHQGTCGPHMMGCGGQAGGHADH